MLLEPAIDKLVDKVDCKYALVCLITKRARLLLDKKNDLLTEQEKSAVTMAAIELQNDTIRVAFED
ncbi:MAG: DNA-directed RNA polymerase subunit omega [Firmicutes bacterium]|nr:DNA-directed RNA polymerase subunit omega [Bacillota bacterium]